ncbi:RMD1 family protein [Magnetospirillum sp. 15-1]|uniref:RMD1 family protein n=1 Tax=Magnetospirillum sp. 15-1 TaxID=1979370 RepID=UPI000BBBCAE6|nr:RMD1 family protein [Magnetospirillum sp. 15-1]
MIQTAIVSHRLSVQVLLLGERLDTKRLEEGVVLATAPLIIRAGREGFAVLFRYGVAVLFGLDPMEEAVFLASLGKLVADPLPVQGRDAAVVQIEPGCEDRVDQSGTVFLADASPQHLQLIAEVLARDLILTHYETRIAKVFDSVEPLALSLSRGSLRKLKTKELLSQIGEVLLAEHRMVGRVELLESPEVLWIKPELERLFIRLEREYDLSGRNRALDRKLEVISDTAETLLDLIQTRSSMKVEWYIVGLILFEIMISIYEMARG